MSYRDALKVFKLERALNDDETAFLNTLRKMSDSDRELLAQSLAPEKPAAKKKPTTERKVEHCIACNYTRRAVHHKDASHKDYHEFQAPSAERKSKRASSIAERVGGTLASIATTVGGNKENAQKIVGAMDDALHQRCVQLGCGEFEASAIHDPNGGYAGYHPFAAPSSPPAPSVSGKLSSRNGEEEAELEASSETGQEDVSNTVHAGG